MVGILIACIFIGFPSVKLAINLAWRTKDINRIKVENAYGGFSNSINSIKAAKKMFESQGWRIIREYKTKSHDHHFLEIEKDGEKALLWTAELST